MMMDNNMSSAYCRSNTHASRPGPMSLSAAGAGLSSRAAGRLAPTRPLSTYRTTNSQYGTEWYRCEPFSVSVTQSTPYKTLANRRQVGPSALLSQLQDRTSLALVHDPAHPCGIQSLSNVASNARGQFTNTRRDFYTDAQGLWGNASFNTDRATIDRGVGTYSNLQGGWGRVGPSTYCQLHADGDWVSRWRLQHAQPAVYRSIYDHLNVNPHKDLLPIAGVPQNMTKTRRCAI